MTKRRFRQPSELLRRFILSMDDTESMLLHFHVSYVSTLMDICSIRWRWSLGSLHHPWNWKPLWSPLQKASISFKGVACVCQRERKTWIGLWRFYRWRATQGTQKSICGEGDGGIKSNRKTQMDIHVGPRNLFESSKQWEGRREIQSVNSSTKLTNRHWTHSAPHTESALNTKRKCLCVSA